MESKIEELWPSFVCAVVFLLLLLWDVCKALRRRAHWAPGQALVLSALTIQMLGLIDYSDISYASNKRERNQQVVILLREDQLLFDCARLMMCVFIGYLLPAMVPRSNWTRVWSDIGALLLSVMVRMGFEVYFVWKVAKPLYWIPNRRQSVWFIVSNITLFTASLLLLLLLSCAVLAGKTIPSILSAKIKLALSCSNSNSPSLGDCKNSFCSDSGGPCKNGCSHIPEKFNIEDHVLKCWIVARVSQPEYIMARSAFSSLAGVVVTIAVVILVVKWTCQVPLPLDYGIAHKTTVFIELTFIFVGWMAVSVRWLTAVMYFPRNAELLFSLEDFWTKSIVELKADLDAQLTRPVYKMKKFSQRKQGQKVLLTLFTAAQLHSVLLPMRVWLQMFMVYASKACWCLSQMLMVMIRPFLMRMLHGSKRGRSQFNNYSKTLELLRMPGETAFDLWIANKMAFKRTQSNMNRGIQKGQNNCAKLKQLLQHRHAGSKEEASKHFPENEPMSLKRKGVSLMYCMVHFYQDTNNFDAINTAVVDNLIPSDIKDDVDKAFETARVINKARKACSKAWDFLDFVDSSDVAADAEFHNLVNMWHTHYKNVKALKKAVQQLGDGTALKNWHGSKDWMRLTVHCNLYKKVYTKFNSFKQNSDQEKGKTADQDNGITADQDKGKTAYQDKGITADQEKGITEDQDMGKTADRDKGITAINIVQSILAYLIHNCLENQLEEVLKEKCNKWAEEGKEEEIYHAAFIAGKAKGLRDKIGECESTAQDQCQTTPQKQGK